VTVPILTPFLVKNAVLSRKFTPQPITSPILKTGPKCLPMFCAVKQRPSSPWYAHDSGSQPTGRDSVAVLVEKPIAMVVLSHGQPVG
jgi:hypothetical protein